MTTEQNGSTFQRWYARQGDRLNERRRKRYHSDPEYRKRAIERARRYRREGPKEGPKEDYKIVHGREQRVYRITEVAQFAGVNQTTLRRWEQEGIIPEPSVDSTIRFYTEYQMQLIAQFVQDTGGRRGDPELREEWVAYMYEHWDDD